MTSRQRVLFAAVVWTAVVVGWVTYQRSSGLGPLEVGQKLVDSANGNWWAILVYALVAAARPVVLFPATLLTVAAGLMFGPVVGTAVAIVGANGSALIAYTIGRTLGRPPTTTAKHAGIGAWTQRLRSNGFEAVLVMRLIFLPYDLVSYVCGLLHVPRRHFLAANAIGTLPGTVAFVLIGASIDRLDEGVKGIDPVTLAISVALVVVSVVVSRVLKRRGVVAGA
jgi:uncharacterized membrane protein YdjX (TVP38/TMEM64 family)